MADDQTRRITSKEQLRALDLSRYRKIKLVETGGEFDGIDWLREEDKGRFLKAAAELDISFEELLAKTEPLFGVLEPPPSTTTAVDAGAFPPFDPMIQTPAEWVALATKKAKEWARAREKEIKEGLTLGIYKKLLRRRNAKKAGIDDDLAYRMAAQFHLFGMTWADLARTHPPPGGYHGIVTKKRQQQDKRESTIRMRVTPILKRLNLPLPDDRKV